MNCMKRVGLLIWMVTLVMILPSGVMADDFKLIPSIAVREEFNDNIFYSSSDTADDFITTISPGLELIERTEKIDLKLLAVVSPFFYADHSDLDDVDQNYFGKGSYKISELLGVNADAGYNVSNRSDRDIETTGIVESNDKRKRQDYGLGFDYTITEINAMAVSGRYAKEKWDSRDLDRQDLETYSAVLNYTHNLSQWVDPTIGRLNFGFGRYKFETSDTYNYFTSIGAQHWFSETVNLLVDLGVRYTDADFFSPQLVFVPPASFQVQIVETNNKSFGGVGTAILEIKGEITRGSFRIAHDIRPASGRGSTVQRSDAVLNLRRRLKERSAIAIATGYYKNKADGDEFSFRPTDEDTFFIRPTIRWEFFEKFTLEAGYYFAYTDDRVANNDTRRNLVYLQVAYGIPLFE
jgi:hypothetical protein